MSQFSCLYSKLTSQKISGIPFLVQIERRKEIGTGTGSGILSRHAPDYFDMYEII